MRLAAWQDGLFPAAFISKNAFAVCRVPAITMAAHAEGFIILRRANIGSEVPGADRVEAG